MCKSQQANDGFFIFGPPCWRCHDLPRTVRHFFLRFLFERFAGLDCCQSACARLRIKLWILSFLGNTKKHKNNTCAFPTIGPRGIQNICAFPSFLVVWWETYTRFHVCLGNTYLKPNLPSYLGNTKITHTRFLVRLGLYSGNTYMFLVFSSDKTRNKCVFPLFSPKKLET